MGMIIRRLDNRRLDEYVNRIRCLHGNFTFCRKTTSVAGY